MRRAVVVGASSGIGREVALLLRERGWTVGVAARREELLSDFELTAQIDVTAADAGQRLLNLVERLGGMDLYFHASGVGHQNRELHEDIELHPHGGHCLSIYGGAWRRAYRCHLEHCRNQGLGACSQLFGYKSSAEYVYSGFRAAGQCPAAEHPLL